MVFDAGRLSLELPRALIAERALSAGGGISVTLGVRPEDVVVDPNGERAVTKVVEPTGHESIVFFDLAGHTVVARVGPDVHLEPAESVGLTLTSTKLHFFGAGDGTRLNQP